MLTIKAARDRTKVQDFKQSKDSVRMNFTFLLLVLCYALVYVGAANWIKDYIFPEDGLEKRICKDAVCSLQGGGLG